MKPVTQSLRRKIKTLFSEMILTSLIVGFLCISFAHVMPAHADMGEMSNHASHGVSLSNCCETGGSDHMELWKSTFVGIPQSSQDLLVLFALAITAVFTFPSFLVTPRLTGAILSFRYRQYAREHPNIRTYDPLRLAFARGILHPKTF
jgi:hypothetical protein